MSEYAVHLSVKVRKYERQVILLGKKSLIWLRVIETESSKYSMDQCNVFLLHRIMEKVYLYLPTFSLFFLTKICATF